VAVDDTETTNEDESFVVVALLNDIDPEDDALTVTSLTQPSYGITALVDGDTKILYRPSDHYNGADSFTYKAYDGNLASEDVATVNITINPINDAPVAVDDIEYSCNEEATIVKAVVEGVLANDTDIDNSHNELEAVVAIGPSHGLLILNIDGSFTYTHTELEPPAIGYDQFTYLAWDGTDFSATVGIAQITIGEVNEKPLASGLVVSVLEDATERCDCPKPCVEFSWEHSDPDGDNLGAYQIQADRQSDFSGAIDFDTGVLDVSGIGIENGDIVNYPMPAISSTLNFENAYYWQVKEWDPDGLESDWVVYQETGSPKSFVTPECLPAVDFTIIPLEPLVGEEVILNAEQGSGGRCQTAITDYLWIEIEYGTIVEEELEEGEPEPPDPYTLPVITVIFTDKVVGGNTVTLRVTNENGSCVITDLIELDFSLPQWEETKPD